MQLEAYLGQRRHDALTAPSSFQFEIEIEDESAFWGMKTQGSASGRCIVLRICAEGRYSGRAGCVAEHDRTLQRADAHRRDVGLPAAVATRWRRWRIRGVI